MCMSPHEMSTQRIEEVLEEIRDYVERHPDTSRYWQMRIDGFEKILKERAEAGMY